MSGMIHSRRMIKEVIHKINLTVLLDRRLQKGREALTELIHAQVMGP